MLSARNGNQLLLVSVLAISVLTLLVALSSSLWLSLGVIAVGLFCFRAFRRERRLTNELTRVREALRVSEERFEQLTENIREVFWLSSADGSKMFYVSPAYEEIFQLTCESLYEQPDSFMNVVHPEDHKALRDLTADLNKGDFEVEFRILRPDGETRWLRTRGFPIRDGDGIPYRLAGLTEDVTESKQAEEALRKSEARNRALFEAMPDLMFRLDRDGTILDYHARGDVPLYQTPDEFLGRKVTAIFPDLGRRFLDAMKIALDRGTMPTVEYRLSLDGTEVEYEARFVRSTENEVLAVVRDITEQKRLEKEVLEVSNREQRRIGHDLHDGISQQLTGVALLCKALQGQLAASNRPEAAQARQIEELLDDAIAQTRSLARGLAPVQLEQGGLAAALEELAVGVETRYSVRCELRTDSGVTVPDHAFATHLYRITQEAVTNALKHGEPSSISIELARQNGRMQLSVQDDGRGLDPEAASDGMGLHIMRYRARMIDATLEIDSDRERGTVVSCEWSPE